MLWKLFERNKPNVDDETENDDYRDDEDDKQDGAEDEILDAIKKLTEMFDDMKARIEGLELAVKVLGDANVKELKAEIDHRSRYMEHMFEQLLDKDFTKSDNGRDRYTRMYRNGKMAGPVGKLPG